MIYLLLCLLALLCLSRQVNGGTWLEKFVPLRQIEGWTPIADYAGVWQVLTRFYGLIGQYPEAFLHSWNNFTIQFQGWSCQSEIFGTNLSVVNKPAVKRSISMTEFQTSIQLWQLIWCVN